MAKNIEIKHIEPCTEEHDQSYGFFVVEDSADRGRELGAFCYHVPGVSSQTACASYPTKEVAEKFALAFAGVIGLWRDREFQPGAPIIVDDCGECPLEGGCSPRCIKASKAVAV
jgi:hypothetical protein